MRCPDKSRTRLPGSGHFVTGLVNFLSQAFLFYFNRLDAIFIFVTRCDLFF